MGRKYKQNPKQKRRSPSQVITNYNNRIKQLENQIKILRNQQYKIQAPKYRQDIKNLKEKVRYEGLSKPLKKLWNINDKVVRAHNKLLSKTSNLYKERIAKQNAIENRRNQRHQQIEDYIKNKQNRQQLQKVKLDKYIRKNQLKRGNVELRKNEYLKHKQSLNDIKNINLYIRNQKKEAKLLKKQESQFLQAFKKEYYQTYNRRYGYIDRMHEKVMHPNYQVKGYHWKTINKEIKRINQYLRKNMELIDFELSLPDDKFIDGLSKSELIKIQEIKDTLEVRLETLTDDISEIYEDTIGDVDVLKGDSKLCEKLYNSAMTLIKDKKMKVNEIALKANVSQIWLETALEIAIKYKDKKIYIRK